MTSSINKIAIVQYGSGDYECYRIPGIVETSRGTLLVYYEDRREGDDWSACNIEIKRSTDSGLTWSQPMRIFKDSQKDTISNPVMIACKNGTVHLLWNINYNRSFHQISTDDGLTFSEPEEITQQLMPWREKYPWEKAVFGPCHGIELKNGRLVTPVWLCNDPGRKHLPSAVSTFASDDGGVTWVCGDIIHSDDFITNPNETCIAELSDGSVMLNMRHTDSKHYRAVSISKDGLTGFSYPVIDMSLPDPICCAGLTSAPNGDLYFSNCASTTEDGSRPPRHHLTIRRSTDSGKTWSSSLEIQRVSGYSDIIASSDGKWLYCFYESEWENDNVDLPHQLVVARVPVELML